MLADKSRQQTANTERPENRKGKKTSRVTRWLAKAEFVGSTVEGRALSGQPGDRAIFLELEAGSGAVQDDTQIHPSNDKPKARKAIKDRVTFYFFANGTGRCLGSIHGNNKKHVERAPPPDLKIAHPPVAEAARQLLGKGVNASKQTAQALNALHEIIMPRKRSKAKPEQSKARRLEDSLVRWPSLYLPKDQYCPVGAMQKKAEKGESIAEFPLLWWFVGNPLDPPGKTRRAIQHYAWMLLGFHAQMNSGQTLYGKKTSLRPEDLELFLFMHLAVYLFPILNGRVREGVTPYIATEIAKLDAEELSAPLISSRASDLASLDSTKRSKKWKQVRDFAEKLLDDYMHQWFREAQAMTACPLCTYRPMRPLLRKDKIKGSVRFGSAPTVKWRVSPSKESKFRRWV